MLLEQTDEPANPEVLDEFTPAPPQRGLENNPGKDGHIFNDTHPYFPKSCSQCAFYRKGENNNLTYFFSRRNKDCFSCRFIKNNMQQAYDKIHEQRDVAPPCLQTYTPYFHGKVLISSYHGENEVEENKHLACFITEKLWKKVYLLPRLDPKDPKYAPLRTSFLPQGVYDGKNPDFYIGGLFFDGKSMIKVIKIKNKNKHHNNILNRIKSAKKQADNAILEIPTFISRRTISSTINGFLKQSNNRIIIVKHGKKCYIYKKTGYKTPNRG